MINRVIGVDFGTSTSVVCYCDYTDGKPGAVEYILFGGHKHSPTLILRDGTVKNKQGVEKHCEEQYGWNAENSNSFYTLLESNFKMDLISADAVKREKAEGLTRKFFAYLFQAYQSGNTVRKGQEPDSVITYITYPGKFPPPVQEFLAGCAKAAGFENVSLLAEACAAMSYAQTHDTEATKKFFDSHQNKALKVMLIDMDEKYMKEAIRQAKKAYAIGEVPIGCVIVYEDKIVGRGYNRRTVDKNTLAHAELIAIKKASKKLGDWRLEGCTMYVTLEPCQMCSGAIVQSRMTRVVVGCMNPKAGCAGSVLNLLQMEEFNHQAELTTGVLGDECSQMMKAFFKELRASKTSKKKAEDQ